MIHSLANQTGIFPEAEILWFMPNEFEKNQSNFVVYKVFSKGFVCINGYNPANPKHVGDNPVHIYLGASSIRLSKTH